jgi:leucyl aminopeptidase (aminopeptidase T)
MISHDPSLYPDYIIAQIQFQARQLAHAGLLALTLEEMLSSRAAYMATCEADWQYHKEQLDAHRAELAAEASAVRVHSNELTRAGFDFDFPEPMNDETFRIVERDDLSDIANLLLRK